MKAIVFTKYGSPDVLTLQKREKPTPKDNEVRVRIHAAAVTPSDCAFRKADPVAIRFMYGLLRPRHAILGVELSGVIDAVGKGVLAFKEGDEVFGISTRTFGAYAEYKCLPEDAVLAIKPSNVSHEAAAGACDGALTSLVFLRDHAKLQRGQSILINGASGSVGAYAVQLAKFYGANVTGVCSTANAELVRSLGANHVIDYTKADFTKRGQTYDVIFDAIGRSSFSHCRDALAPRGIYLSTVPSPAILLSMLRTARSSGKKAIFVAAGLRQQRVNLDFLRELIEDGQIRPVIDRLYPLEQAADAHRYVETGRKKGNVILTIAPTSGV
ncbi:Alcohol dehydrogenase zinc-binding domain protein [Paenibacillus curdlanolyticus YK9]|uniref:Alcohol dehydrogenase zinc-binding domain protein n=1 Tax=Paenibacillus curdlanolyticus YK9 TaxID=717606 RepID=E0IGF5_9BACL|nr:NAD(P)-dependent alcohol dehydrogenase [Paenibacillus curdlanolyticus]EFM08455.1 Alcohol dehydrogenase zinc-binding domain protein [Paenibacillus curdlanolyticus YK9]